MVSAAHRTVGTWESVAAGGGFDLEPYLSEVLYGAGPETALDLLREAPDDVTAVIVIGHNPTMASLASLIDDGDGDPAVTSEMLSGYPTSAVAVFEYDGAWSDLTEAGARLVAYHVGRGSIGLGDRATVASGRSLDSEAPTAASDARLGRGAGW